jgi:hypothetical protein
MLQEGRLDVEEALTSKEILLELSAQAMVCLMIASKLQSTGSHIKCQNVRVMV